MIDTYLGVWAPEGTELTQEEWVEIQGIVAEALSTSRFHALDFDVNFEEVP